MDDQCIGDLLQKNGQIPLTCLCITSSCLSNPLTSIFEI